MKREELEGSNSNKLLGSEKDTEIWAFFCSLTLTSP
jgi:hypothetical protein